MKMFNDLAGLMSARKPRIRDEDLRTWARIEYKKDAEYAYTVMKETGIAPMLGVK